MVNMPLIFPEDRSLNLNAVKRLSSFLSKLLCYLSACVSLFLYSTYNCSITCVLIYAFRYRSTSFQLLQRYINYRYYIFHYMKRFIATIIPLLEKFLQLFDDLLLLPAGDLKLPHPGILVSQLQLKIGV